MQNLEEKPGIKVGGPSIKGLKYTDDTVIDAENKKHLQWFSDIVQAESRKKRF